MLILLFSYFLARPLISLGSEALRTACMLTWSRKELVHLHLGSYGHIGGLTVRMGRLVIRIHPFWFLMRGSISDTFAKPAFWQAAIWCAIPLLTNALLFAGALFFVWSQSIIRGWDFFVAVAGFVAFLDLGNGFFREMQALGMQCGLVYVGPWATLSQLFRFRRNGMTYMQGLGAFLREDYETAASAFSLIATQHRPTMELLEDLAFAQLVTGHSDACLATYAALLKITVPNSTQMAVSAMALWNTGDQTAAMDRIDQAVTTTPGHAMARNFRGWMELQVGMLAEAGVDLLTATHNAPEYATAWANLATVHLRAGNFAQALVAAETAFKHDPLDLTVLRVLLELRVWHGDAAAAEMLRGRISVLEGRG